MTPRFKSGDYIILSNKFFTKVCQIVIIEKSKYHILVIETNKDDAMDWMGIGSIAESRAVKLDASHPAWILYLE